ncbi:MAG: formate/nitrite transporter family protein [Alphaproteobacteria bacterium]
MANRDETAFTLLDAYAPAEVARRVESAGVAKAGLPLVPTLALGVLAGAFIAFGSLFYLVAVTDSGLGYGIERIVGGICFSLGLILVVVAGAELFTGNNLIAIAWADRKITSRQLLRNWGLVFVANFAGAVATAVIVDLSGIMGAHNGALAETVVRIAADKSALPFGEAFLRGLLCNALVCLAVWLAMAAHSVSGKILAIVFPIAAFVALGLEHSVANMFLIPLGLLVAPDGPVAGLTLGGLASNLVPVTLGNIVGGSVFVALVYYVVYIRGVRPQG